MKDKKKTARKIAIIVVSCLVVITLLTTALMTFIAVNNVNNAKGSGTSRDESSSANESSSADESIDKGSTSADESIDESGKAEESSDESSEIEEELFLTRTNYYDTDGTLIYYEGYSYYENGRLCSSTLFSVNYYENEVEYVESEYAFLYLYDDKGKLIERVLGDFSGVTLGADSGEVVLDYIYDEDENVSEVSIYPEKETIEQKKFGVDPSKTEEIYGDAYIIDTDASKWAEVYLENAFNETDLTDITDITECRFIYVNDDDVPELWIDYIYGFAGARVFTQENGKTDVIYISHGSAEWIEKENLMLAYGGHMDGYWDELYKIEDGEFVCLSSGVYGAIAEEVQRDEDGLPIYTYEWNGAEVTEEEYFNHVENAFDSSLAADKNTCVFTYDQCKLLLDMLANSGV